jgi:hypothetical protein
MAGVITIKFSVMKGGMKQLDMKSPIYIPGPVEPQFGPGRYIYFEGFSVDEHGKQHYLDATVAYRQTCLRVIEYLRRFGEFAILLSAFFARILFPCSALVSANSRFLGLLGVFFGLRSVVAKGRWPEVSSSFFFLRYPLLTISQGTATTRSISCSLAPRFKVT